MIMPKVLCFRYIFGMTKFDEIYETAADNHGLISSA